MPNLTVCRFWQNGTCRNGKSCRFDHPNGQNSSSQSSNNQNSGNRQGGFGRGAVFGSASRPDRWALNEEDTRNDLTITRPQWILSAYGPGKEPPASLFTENEYSPEEVRWRFYEQQAKGNANAADQEAIKIWNDADSAMRTVAANIRDIQAFMEQKEREHPNRYDFTNIKFDGKISREEHAKNTQLNQQPGSSVTPFGGTANRATATTNPFSRPTFGQSSSPFAQPAQSSSFGQPAQPSSFGQPSQPSSFGKPTQTASFGQTAFGQPSQPSTFGQPSQPSSFGQPAQPSAFGKPAFGQSSFGQSGFGQTSSPFSQAKSSFGQPVNGSSSSPFGAKPADSSSGSGFGQTSTPGQTSSPFAKPSAASGFGSNTAGSGFGQSGFGQTAAPASNSSPFGQQTGPSITQLPSAQTTTQGNSASPFGNAVQPVSNTTAFGANTTSQTSFGPSPFGKPSAFGQPQQKSAFGQPSQIQQQPTSAFGQPSQPQSNFGPSPFGKPAQQPGFGQNPFNQQSQSQPQSQPQPQPQPQASSEKPSGSSQAFGSSPFGQPAPDANTTPVATAAGTETSTASVPPTKQPGQSSSSKLTNQPVQLLHYSQTLPNVPPQMGAGGDIATFRGIPVRYIEKTRPSADGRHVLDSRNPVYNRPDGKGQERIWFPQGANNPDVTKLANKLSDFQAEEEDYTDEIRAQFGRLFETGRFDQGGIPLVPPMRGWVDYDF